MRPLHIALVTETYPPEINGVATTLGRMASALRGRGHGVSLVRPRQGREPGGAEAGAILVRGLPVPGYPGLRFGLPCRRRLLRRWQVQRPDIVHIATEGPLGWSAMAVARRLGIPVVAGFHTNFHSYSRHYGVGWLQGPINAYLRHFHNRAQLTLVPTRQLQQALQDDRYRHVAVMARGVDTALFDPARRDTALRRAWGVQDSELAVLHVGRLAPEKNLGLLVRAFEAIRQQHPGSRLVLVGDGPAARALRCEHPEFVFAGARVGEVLARHYASADLFLFPSLTETFGNVLLEAMASGLAAVAFDDAAAALHLVHRRNGLKASKGEKGAFVRLAVALAAAPADRARYGSAARQTALALTWEAVFDGLVEDYRALLAGRIESA